jgi:hypothetical protein
MPEKAGGAAASSRWHPLSNACRRPSSLCVSPALVPSCCSLLQLSNHMLTLSHLRSFTSLTSPQQQQVMSASPSTTSSIAGLELVMLKAEAVAYERLLVTHGADHRETLIYRYNMACSLSDQDRWVDALSMYEQLLEKQTRVLSLDDPLTLQTTVSLVQ